MTVSDFVDGDRDRVERLTELLVASSLGIYLLVLVGAATAILDGAVACPTWPACNGRLVVPFSDPALLAAWGHRVATLVVGALLLWTAVVAWRCRETDTHVRATVVGTTLLYPLQIVIGAATVTVGPAVWLATVHLIVGMLIFSGVLVALLWHLESTTQNQESTTKRTPATGGTTGTASTSGYERAAVLRESSRAAAGDGASRSRLRWAKARVVAYLQLTKPKLMWLLCLVALAAMGLAAGPTLSMTTVVPTLAGGVLAIGASGTFNNVLERDRDRKMERTADRPVVQGRIPIRRAVAFGVGLAIASVGTFVAFANVLSAALGLLAIVFYSVVYTLVLKPHTSQNIVLGGAVGAFPALIGWAAVTETVGVPALMLGAVIFLWTPAHFYNLALAYKDDYDRADFPMLPVVAGEATTRRHILAYLGATLASAVLLGAITRLGPLYVVTAVVVGGVFLWAVVRLFQEQTTAAAFRTFHASNAYLGTMLVAILVDTLAV